MYHKNPFAKELHAFRTHCKRRLFSRLGLEVNHFDLMEIVAKIQAGKVVAKKSLTRVNRSLQLVKFRGEVIPFIYDARVRMVVTALPGHDLQSINLLLKTLGSQNAS